MKELDKAVQDSRQLAHDIGKMLHEKNISVIELVTTFACLTCDTIIQADEYHKLEKDLKGVKKICDLYKELVVSFLKQEGYK
jgi:hypothetical protein